MSNLKRGVISKDQADASWKLGKLTISSARLAAMIGEKGITFIEISSIDGTKKRVVLHSTARVNFNTVEFSATDVTDPKKEIHGHGSWIIDPDGHVLDFTFDAHSIAFAKTKENGQAHDTAK